MLKIYQKYVTNNEKITKEELDQANKQFSDLLKGLGLAGVFALPGGLLAIAFIVKLGEKLGVDIIPEKYRKWINHQNSRLVFLFSIHVFLELLSL